jgi:hypothetical protein
MVGPPMPFTCRHGNTNVAIVANAPQPQSISSEKQHPPKPKGRRRPYFFKMLQQRIGTHILADTLDWDGEFLTRSRPCGVCLPPFPRLGGKSELYLPFFFSLSLALSHFNFDASVLSLDNLFKALNHDMETYYHLWVAVHKVLAEAPSNNM